MQLARDRARDLVSRCFVDVLGHRVSAIYSPNVVNTMRTNWEKNNQPQMATETARQWGEYMSGAAMLSSFFKGEERVTMRLLTNEMDGYVEAMSVGEIRGYMHQNLNPSVSPLFQVNKMLYGAATPYKTVLAATGNAKNDWQSFYDQSEQTPTLIKLETKTNDDQRIVCCGLTIQEMPNATVSLMKRRDQFNETVMMEVIEQQGMLAYLNTLFPEKTLTKEDIKRIPVDYYCRCSKERFIQRLYSVPRDDLASLSAQGGVSLSCNYCNESYYVDSIELDCIVNEKS